MFADRATESWEKTISLSVCDNSAMVFTVFGWINLIDKHAIQEHRFWLQTDLPFFYTYTVANSDRHTLQLMV